jgi:hypothetical protein
MTMKRRVVAFGIVGLVILGATVHAAAEYATEGTCWLCAFCPF